MNVKEAHQAEAYNEDEHQSDSKQSIRGTHADEHDMQMLGKTQQLNVSILTNHLLRLQRMLIHAAKFQVHLHSRIFVYCNEHMGDHPFVKYIRLDQWWTAWSGLGLFYCVDGLFHGLRLDI